MNTDTLDLAVQNTNVKAKQLLKGDLQRQTNILAALLRKWIAGVASKPNPGAADLARLKSLYEVHAALLGMYPVLVRHIESSSKEEMAAEEKKLAELQDLIQAGLAAVSEGDPAGQVEGRAALAEIRSLQASILKLSRNRLQQPLRHDVARRVEGRGGRVHGADRRPRQAPRRGGHDRPGPQRGRVHDRAGLDPRRHARGPR